MRVPLLILLATSALAFTAACGASEEEMPGIATSPTAAATPSPDPLAPAPAVAPILTPGPGVALWRWGDIVVLVPDGSGISAMPSSFGAASPGSNLAALRVDKKDPADPAISSYVLVNARDGTAQSEEVRTEHRAALDAVLATVQIAPLDKTAMPWPYREDNEAALTREEFMGFSVVDPSPSTGLYVSGGLADPGGVFVSLTNGRSAAFVKLDPVTGERQNDTTAVLADDLMAFERWLATVKRCGTEIACSN